MIHLFKTNCVIKWLVTIHFFLLTNEKFSFCYIKNIFYSLQDFMWAPMVNQTMLDIYKPWIRSQSKAPSVIVTGIGVWAIKVSNASMDMLNNYKYNLTHLVPILNSLVPVTKVLWVLQDPVIYEKLLSSRKMITNEQIDMYNKAAMDTL